MDVMHGGDGATGRPATVDDPDLSFYGLRGNGILSIRTRDDPPSETWMWNHRVEEYPTDLGTETVQGLPESLLTEWGRMYSTHMAVLSEQSHTRLTGPIRFIRKLLVHWNLNPTDAIGLLGFDPSDASHVAGVLDGIGTIRGRDVRDRIAHLISIRATLWSLFRNLEVENDWLREPHRALENKRPMSLLLGGSMEDLLLVREFVEAAAGR